MKNIGQLIWSPQLEKKIEGMLRTGVYIIVSAVTCLLAVLWYISPNQG
jgi:hypothetical protein